MLFKVITTMASVFMSERPWWLGVPTTLVRKTLLVSADELSGRLPVYTLTFSIPPADELSGRAKAHSKVNLHLGDIVKMVIPNYKPKSYSISDLREDEFDVTIKVYPNGRASGFLDSLEVGQTTGSFGMSAGRQRNPGSYVGIISYGVGITEGLPVARAELEANDAKKVVLVWAVRNYDDVFWSDEIQNLQTRYPDRFEITHVVSRETQATVRKGDIAGQRIDANLLAKIFTPEDGAEARFLSVGTKAMMRQTEDLLESIGYPMPKHALLPKLHSR